MTCGEWHKHFLECNTCKALAANYMTSKAGSTKSAKKAASSRENGKLGGRPRKS